MSSVLTFSLYYYGPVFVLFLAFKIIDNTTCNKVGLITKKSKIHFFVIDAVFAFLMLCFGVFFFLIKQEEISLAFLIIPIIISVLLFLLSSLIERKLIKKENQLKSGPNKIPISITIFSLFGISVFISVFFWGILWILTFFLRHDLRQEQLISHIVVILFPILLTTAFCLIKLFINKRILARVI